MQVIFLIIEVSPDRDLITIVEDRERGSCRPVKDSNIVVAWQRKAVRVPVDKLELLGIPAGQLKEEQEGPFTATAVESDSSFGLGFSPDRR